ncbi:Leucine-rich repeat-containing protein [Echinococcus granulosus]|uniref:Leucine-rich repeat-containing protein n=1 Tax=Echinococcus granulosus TaxID=6210 RepID=W6UG49_ECHGR|nr:Leucine-rich repeat-containing protein [Echinococcus granulosus]EUB60460.1 Leucine-rich repeat-containing protein [Echinococcus granulosus]
MVRHFRNESSKYLSCSLLKDKKESPQTCQLESVEGGGIILRSSKFKKSINALDVLSIYQSSTQLVLNILDGSTVTLTVPLDTRTRSEPISIVKSILNVWKKYFPSYNFCGEAIHVDGNDELKLPTFENACRIPNVCEAVKQGFSYVHKRFGEKCDNNEIIELLGCNERKYLRFPDVVPYFPYNMPNFAICPLLTPSFFTVFDLGYVKMDEDFIHLCSIGLRTNKALRSIIFRDSQIDSDELRCLLRSLPNSFKLRKLDVTSKEPLFSKVFEDLKPKIYQQLVDLRIGTKKIDDGTFMRTIAHIKPKSSEKLPLRRIVLSGTCIRSPALQELTLLAPELRVLILDRCDLGISEICSALDSSDCARLEVLSLAESKFVRSETVVQNYFTSLRFLQVLSLRGTSGKAAYDVLKLIFSGLCHVKNPVYNQLDLDLSECKLDAKVAELIAQYIPKVAHLTKISLTENAFKDKVVDIIQCLPKCPRLQHVTLGNKGKPNGSGFLKKLTEALSLSECKVAKITLHPLGSNEEMCEFLKSLANLGKKLAYLDISEYTLKDEDSRCILELIQYHDPKTPLTLTFNASFFSDDTWTALGGLAKRKRFLINQCNKPVIVLQQSDVDVKGLLELDKFSDAIITPSPELCDADLELTHLAIELQRKMPTSNVEQLEPHYPKIHQAKIALQECSKLPSMHVDLLDAALDPEACNHAVEQVMGDIRAVLKKSLQAFHEKSCQRLKDVVNNKSLQSFASVAKFSPAQITENSLEPISWLLNQQVENSVRSMFLDANVKIAEQMLCKVTTGLKDDIEKCLDGFPERVDLKPLRSVDTRNQEYINCPVRSHTVAVTALYLNPKAFKNLPLDVPSGSPVNKSKPADDLPMNATSGSPANKLNPVDDQSSSGFLAPLSHARPVRKKNHMATTIIHTSASEVVHGPVDTADLFPTSNLSPKEGENQSADPPEGDVGPPLPTKMFSQSPSVKPGVSDKKDGVTMRHNKQKEATLQKAPKPAIKYPQLTDIVALEHDNRKSVAELTSCFERSNPNGCHVKSVYSPPLKDPNG